MSKHMRLPNGFGQITKISNRRLRNPYRAMVTIGKTPTGRPICKLLKPQAYFKTYNDAYTALLEYNRNPYDVTKTAVFKEVYEKWLPGYERNKSLSAIKAVEREYQLCESVWYTDLRQIRPIDIKTCMDQTESPKYKRGIKFIFSEVLSLGMEIGVVESNIARD